MKNVLHLVTSPSKGGRELYCITLIEEMHKKGWNCFVYGIKNSYVINELEKKGIKTLYQTFGGRFHIKETLYLLRFIRENKIDVIHSHTRLDVTRGSLVTLGSKIPNIYSIYMGVAPKTDFLHRFFHNRVDAFLSSSIFSNRQIQENFIVPAKKIFLSRYGRVLSNYNIPDSFKAEIRAKHNVPEGTLIAGVMSRIDPGKGIREFVESYKLLPKEAQDKLIYVIMGEPTIGKMEKDGTPLYEEKSKALSDYVDSFIADNNLEKKIVRLPFNKEYLKFMKAIDIFVLPSHDEMYSLSVLDAMIMGLPVIATSKGGTPEQVEEGVRGLLVPPKDAVSLSEAITRFTMDEELRNSCAKNGKDWALVEHDMNNTLDKIFEIYEDVAITKE